MTEPVPLSIFTSNYFCTPFPSSSGDSSTSKPLSTDEYVSQTLSMPYNFIDPALQTQIQRMVCIEQPANGQYSINQSLGHLLKNIKINVYKAIPPISDTSLLYVIRDTDDFEFIDPKYFNSNTRLIIAVGKYFNETQRNIFNTIFKPKQPPISKVIQSIEGRIVDIIKVNWDGEPGSNINYTLPDILILPGQSLWFFAIYDRAEFSEDIKEDLDQSRGNISMIINMQYQLSTIEAKTIYGYPFPTIDVDAIWRIADILQ